MHLKKLHIVKFILFFYLFQKCKLLYFLGFITCKVKYIKRFCFFMQSWLEGRDWIRKGAQATGMTVSLRILSIKADSNTWESFTRSDLKLESVHQESPRSDIFRKRATKTLLKQKHRQKHLTWAKEKNKTGLLLSGPKSSFQMKVNLAFHLEIKVPESGGRMERHRIHVAWSPVWKFWSQSWFGVPRLLVLVHCVLSSSKTMQPSTRRFWSTLCFHLLTSFIEMLISFSSRIWHLPTLPKAPKVGQMTMCWCAWLASKLTRTEPHRESMGYCQEKNEKQETKKMSWRPLSKKPGLPYHLSSATNWSPPCHAALRQ